jgi:hypothetical protein
MTAADAQVSRAFPTARRSGDGFAGEAAVRAIQMAWALERPLCPRRLIDGVMPTG